MDDNEDVKITIGDMLDRMDGSPEELTKMCANLLNEMQTLTEFLEFHGHTEKEYLEWRDEMNRRTLH